MLDLYKLEIFLRVTEAGSFSAAAEQLLMTQSGVSQHIKELETGLGAELFQRSRRGVALTAAGRTLLGYAREILTLVAAAENAVTDVERLPHGQVRIGATPGVSIYLLADAVQAFRARYPRLTVALHTQITPEIVTDLLAQRLDLGFVEGELEPQAEAQLGVAVLDEIEQFVIVGSHHPFWARPELTPAELDGQTFVLRQPRSQTRIWLDQALHAHGVRPRIAAEFDNIESIKRAVAAGRGVAILPEYAVRDEQALGILRAVPLQAKPLQRTLKVIWDRRRFFTPVCRALLVHLRTLFPALDAVVTAT